MATFTTYYSTGSLQRGTIKHHHTNHSSKADAIKKACELSKKTGEYVGVMKSGITVAMTYKGKQVKL